MMRTEHVMAFVVAAGANTFFFGLALAGTGNTPMQSLVVCILAVPLIVGLVLAGIVKGPFKWLFLAAGIPCAGLALLMVQGSIEEKDVTALKWLSILASVVVLLILPLGLRRLYSMMTRKAEHPPAN